MPPTEKSRAQRFMFGITTLILGSNLLALFLVFVAYLCERRTSTATLMLMFFVLADWAFRLLERIQAHTTSDDSEPEALRVTVTTAFHAPTPDEMKRAAEAQEAKREAQEVDARAKAERANARADAEASAWLAKTFVPDRGTVTPTADGFECLVARPWDENWRFKDWMAAINRVLGAQGWTATFLVSSRAQEVSDAITYGDSQLVRRATKRCWFCAKRIAKFDAERVSQKAVTPQPLASAAPPRAEYD